MRLIAVEMETLYSDDWKILKAGKPLKTQMKLAYSLL